MPLTETKTTALHREAWTVFLAESRERSSKKNSNESLIDHESQKINKSVLSTTVAELHPIHEVLWFMSVSPWIVDGQIR